jgi:hypothetical protein
LAQFDPLPKVLINDPKLRKLKNASTWLRRSCFRTTTFSLASIP